MTIATATPSTAPDKVDAVSFDDWSSARRKTEVSNPSRSTARKAIRINAPAEPAARAAAAFASSPPFSSCA